MDDASKKMIEDCFLRALPDAHSTNTTLDPPPPKQHLKTELQVLRLSEESQNLVLSTLKSIHGPNFKLKDSRKYKDRGERFKRTYWDDRGTLMVQSVSDFSNMEHKQISPQDQLRKYAALKLESYGFPSRHCYEAIDHSNGQVDKALEVLFNEYMKRNLETNSEEREKEDYSEKELLDMREDEKLVLESIYDKDFEEKEKNVLWSLRFNLDYLLIYSPTKKKILQEIAKTEEKSDQKPKEKCRNFAKGHCKFGDKCWFSHHVEEKNTNIKEYEEEENWFYLEIRFSKEMRYPFEAPMIFFKTACHDIPRNILLRITRKLYKEAIKLAQDGMPSIYTLCELLQMEEEMLAFLDEDSEVFPDPEKSLFHTGEEKEGSNKEVEKVDLPSHYKMGSTGKVENKLSFEQISREDKKLVQKFLEKQSNSNYIKMMLSRRNLPAWDCMLEILDTVEKSQVVVISGETGCGKSTQIPQFLLDNWLFQSSKLDDTQMRFPHCEIICTQPRRISAIGVAERVAEERAESVGNTIGYQIRLENKISATTRLFFCTTGILLRRLYSDPLLESVNYVIVDEVHERSEESDFLLLMLKRILKERSDLKVILMSATLNSKLFSEYFGGAPILEIPGRTFPVQQYFLEDILDPCRFVLEMDSQYCRHINKKKHEDFMAEVEYSDIETTRVAPPKSIKDENLNFLALGARYPDCSKSACKTIYFMDFLKVNPDLIEAVLRYIVWGDHDWPKEGTILVFLPGYAEIQTVYDSLNDSTAFGPRSNKFVIIPLHSSLSNEEQTAVFRKAPEGKRKIVLSTNIAETSITIDDCVFVIDSGLMKEKRFDSNKNMESLDLVWESKANAMQRKGRAGRVMPGVCIHLFTSNRYLYHFLNQPVPEIQRVPLEQLLLRIKTLPIFQQQDVRDIIGALLEPPTEEGVSSAVIRLQNVGAFDEEQNLTPLGHHLSALPVDVRIGKLMLFGAIFQCLDSVLTIAACLSHKTPFVSPFNKKILADAKKKKFAVNNSDHLTVLKAYKSWLEACKKRFGMQFAEENFLSWRTLKAIGEVKYQFLELLVSIGFVPIDLPSKKKMTTDNILEITGSSLNLNGNNYRILVSLLCAALYPNIVKVLTPERNYTMTASGAMPRALQASDLRFKTREDGFVSIHPSSVNADVGHFLSPFLIYQEKVKTSKVFIRECSMVPQLPLVLFAGCDLKIELHSGEFIVLLEDGWIMLKAHNHETAEMILCLRQEFFKLLEEKIRDPCLNLLSHENGKKIISTIVSVIMKD